MIRSYDYCFAIFSHPEFVPGNSFKPPSIQSKIQKHFKPPSIQSKIQKHFKPPSIQSRCKSTSNLHPFNPRFKSTSNLHPFNRDAKALQTSIHSIEMQKHFKPPSIQSRCKSTSTSGGQELLRLLTYLRAM